MPPNPTTRGIGSHKNGKAPFWLTERVSHGFEPMRFIWPILWDNIGPNNALLFGLPKRWPGSESGCVYEQATVTEASRNIRTLA